ncbi:hypothetical protein EVAR_49916_1 [Eumeta japonica]|uniref:Uncharacterized protein n=1 Tax=Eumeta variegata TaxID=151549 RepID=A0A4C1Y3W4_EUMVA|nr:hypothetical protein EVAR_49916_1 [Eumeta japonica]
MVGFDHSRPRSPSLFKRLSTPFVHGRKGFRLEINFSQYVGDVEVEDYDPTAAAIGRQFLPPEVGRDHQSSALPPDSHLYFSFRQNAASSNHCKRSSIIFGRGIKYYNVGSLPSLCAS